MKTKLNKILNLTLIVWVYGVDIDVEEKDISLGYNDIFEEDYSKSSDRRKETKKGVYENTIGINRIT